MLPYGNAGRKWVKGFLICNFLKTMIYINYIFCKLYFLYIKLFILKYEKYLLIFTKFLVSFSFILYYTKGFSLIGYPR